MNFQTLDNLLNVEMDESNLQNTPFQNYVDRPNLDTLDKVLYCLGIAVSPVNLVFTLLACYVSIKDFKRLHKNFVLLRYCILICFISIGIGHLIVCLSCVLENLIMPKNNQNSWMTGVYINIIGNDCIRCFFVSIFIERTIATAYSKFYEKSNKIWISFLLIFVSTCLGACIAFIKLQNQDLMIPFYCIGLLIDITGCIFIYFLRRYNKKKRKINTRSTIILSQRFQLTENIKILRSIFPIITTGVGISLFGTIYTLASFNIPALFDYWRYSTALYYLLYNSYCFISIILYAYTDPYYRKTTLIPCKREKILDVVSHSSTIEQTVSIKNVNGEDITKKLTNEEYFKSVQQQWEVPANLIKNNRYN